MRDYLSSEVRNVCVIGHSGAGKTSVLESMLYYTKATDRFGKTSEGSSMIDFDAEEIRRGISVYTSIVPIEWEDCKINLSIHQVILILLEKNKLDLPLVTAV